MPWLESERNEFRSTTLQRPNKHSPQRMNAAGRGGRIQIESAGLVVVHIVVHRVFGQASLDNSAKVVEASALAKLVPRANVFQLGHHFDQLIDKHLRHALDRNRSTLVNRSGGLHQPNHAGSLHDRAGKGLVGFLDEFTQRHIERPLPFVQIAEPQVG